MVFCNSARVVLTLSATTRGFSPNSIIATPTTISPLPFSVAKPRRTLGAKCTLAILRIRIGVPVEEFCYDDIFDIGETANQSFSPDEGLLLCVFEISSSRIGVILRESFQHPCERNV